MDTYYRYLLWEEDGKLVAHRADLATLDEIRRAVEYEAKKRGRIHREREADFRALLEARKVTA